MYLLDTNSIIYAINDKLILRDSTFYVSFITELELLSYHKLSRYEEKQIIHLLKQFQIIDINNNIKFKTIKIRKKYNLKLPDSIIVASAIENDLVLVTSDKKLLNLDILKVIEIKDLY